MGGGAGEKAREGEGGRLEQRRHGRGRREGTGDGSLFSLSGSEFAESV